MAAAVWSTQEVAGLEQLPLEITLDIMSRLPFESVGQCKLVCRSWRSLLRLNNFAKLHLQQQQKQITSRGNQFDFLTKYCPDKYGTRGHGFQFLDYIDHDDTDDDNDHEIQVVDDDVNIDDDDDADDEYYSSLFCNYRVRKAHHPLIIDYHYRHHKHYPWWNYFIQVEGSCNGLVCLSCYADPTYICNPLTGEYINLPKHDQYYNRNDATTTITKRKEKNDTTTSYIVSGFGYHPLTEEYKVVRIYYEKASRCGKGQVEVYTVGKDCGRWRNKGQICSHVLDSSQRGVLVNGTIYWLTPMYNLSGLGIVAFDLAKEEFYAVANLPEEWSHYESPSRIRKLGGCLSLINLVELYSTDVWMMKDSTRGNETWVKEFSIPENWASCDPFTITKNGEMLAWYNYKDSQEVFLARYNPKTGDVEQYIDNEVDATITRNVRYGAVPHIKSFISLKDLGEEDARGLVARHEKVQMSLKRKASSCLNFNPLSD